MCCCLHAFHGLCVPCDYGVSVKLPCFPGGGHEKGKQYLCQHFIKCHMCIWFSYALWNSYTKRVLFRVQTGITYDKLNCVSITNLPIVWWVIGGSAGILAPKCQPVSHEVGWLVKNPKRVVRNHVFEEYLYCCSFRAVKAHVKIYLWNLTISNFFWCLHFELRHVIADMIIQIWQVTCYIIQNFSVYLEVFHLTLQTSTIYSWKAFTGLLLATEANCANTIKLAFQEVT